MLERFFPPRAEEGRGEAGGGAPRAGSKAWRAIARWVPVLLVLAGCGYLATTVDRASLADALASVRVAPLILAIVLAGLGVVAHAGLWATFLRPTAVVPLGAMTAYSYASSAASILLPFRAGEALRVWLLRRHHGVPLVASGAVIALEKTVDVVSLLLLASPLPWLLPDLPPSVRHALTLLPAIAGAAIVALALAARGGGTRWLSGFRVLKRPGLVLRGFAFGFSAWLIDVAAITTTLYATNLTPTPGRALTVLLFVNLAIAIPAAPGQVGSHELGSTVALKLLGVAPPQALAFALLFHATQLAPVILIGLVSARVLAKLEVPAPEDAQGLAVRSTKSE